MEDTGCVQLKTIGLIYGWFGVGVCIGFLYHTAKFKNYVEIAISIVVLLLNFGLLHGIYRQKPKFMLPALVLSTIVSCVFVILVFYLPTGLIFILSLQNDLRTIQKIINGTFGYWIVSCVATVFHAYLTIVQYSLYKTMKDAIQHPAGYVHPV